MSQIFSPNDAKLTFQQASTKYINHEKRDERHQWDIQIHRSQKNHNAMVKKQKTNKQADK